MCIRDSNEVQQPELRSSMHSLELEEIARRLALHIGIGVRVVSERNFRIAQHHCAMGYKIREQPAAHSGLQVDALDSKRKYVRLSRPHRIPIGADPDYEIRRLESRHDLRASVTCLLYTSDAADERSSVDLG